MKKALLIAIGIYSGSCCAQNYLDSYLTGTPTYTTIASGADQVSQPRDLDFKPNSNELWVVNKGDANGSGMVIVYNAGQTNQRVEYRQDSHSGHFMMYGSAIAFGDNGNWGSTGEIKNTASPSSTFMGPTLWSGDTSIFATVFQSNWVNGKPLGSHLDMLHQSPFSMGIAHDNANIYWVFDGHNGNLCKYDFGTDHSPGYDDHSNGKIWRYSDVPLTRVANIPGHMVLDKASGWLYLVDAGTKKLKRVNTATGSISGTLTVPGTSPEALAGYWAFTGATVQVLDSFLATQPTGVDVYNGRLIVSDHDNGDIHLYDISGATPAKLGTIATGQAGIMGVKIGPDGKIWFVNYTTSTVVRINPAATPNNDAAIDQISAPMTNNTLANFYHPGFNICNTSTVPAVVLRNAGANTLTSATINYKLDNGTATSFSWTGSLAPGGTATVSLPAATLTNGEHLLNASVSNPNGSPDSNPANNSKDGSFRSRTNIVNYPYSERFSTTTFPPAGWTYLGYNFNNPMSHDATVGSFGHASNLGAVVMDNYSSAEDIAGQVDYLMLPRLNMSSASATAKLSFDVAYAQFDPSSNDVLSVRASTDCGGTWTEIFSKSGTNLTTAPPSSIWFSPADSQWRMEVVSLSNYAGQSNLMLMFVATSDHGNNLYIDNVNIASTVGINRAEAGELAIYPNPTSGIVFIKLGNTNQKVQVAVSDILGREVIALTEFSSGTNPNIDLSSQANGTYIIRVIADGQTIQKKISLMK